jgi:hypothetical protein
MGLFDFFTKKPASLPVQDLVWMHKTAKWKGCLKLVDENPDAILVSWFPAATAELSRVAEEYKITTLPEIKEASRVMASMVENRTVIFLEHYPLRSKEEALMKEWKTKQVYILNAMDEPLLTHAGGQQIIDLMKKMGMADDERIENSLVSSSITKVQQKLEKSVPFESTASSTEDWFRKNSPESI